MAVKRDYYDILGVPKDADEAEIKRAFRRLAQRHHPDIDTGDGAEERFKELNEAYRVLSDRQRRTAYDMFGHAGRRRRGRGRIRGIRRRIRAIRRHLRRVLRRRPRRDAAASAGRARRRPALRPDDRLCRGRLRGHEGRSASRRSWPALAARDRAASRAPQPETCPDCNGTGEQRRVAQTILGQMVNIVACARCRGEGRIIATPCTPCGGDGRVREERSLEVTIPAGIDDGQRIAHRGPGRGGSARRSERRPVRRDRGSRPRGARAARHRAVPRAADHVPPGGARRDADGPDGRGDARRSRCPPASSPATRSACAARACRACAGAGRGDLHVVVNVVVPIEALEARAGAPPASSTR